MKRKKEKKQTGYTSLVNNIYNLTFIRSQMLVYELGSSSLN